MSLKKEEMFTIVDYREKQIQEDENQKRILELAWKTLWEEIVSHSRMKYKQVKTGFILKKGKRNDLKIKNKIIR